MQFAHLDVEMIAEDPVELPMYAGSTLHGGFKQAIKRCACMAGGCGEHCEQPEVCGYGLLFDTPVPESALERLQNNDAVPPPVFLRPPQRTGLLSPGDVLEFECRIIGPLGLRHIDDFVVGWQRMAQRGLGNDRDDDDRGSLRLSTLRDADSGEVLYEASEDVYPPRTVPTLDLDPPEFGETDGSPEAIVITARTPLHCKYDGDVKRELDFREFVYQVVDRYRVLGTCWGESPEDVRSHAPHPRDVADEASEADVRCTESASRFLEIPRSSSPLEGVVGRWRFEGEIGPFVELLEMGERLHIGAKTGFGFGAYDLHVEQG